MTGPGAKGKARGTPLVGRGPVVDSVADAIGSEGPGPTLVWIEGEAGFGKSSVLEAAIEEVAATRVLRARAEPMDLDRPFSVAARLLGLPRPSQRDIDGEGALPATGTSEGRFPDGSPLTIFDQLPRRRHRIATALRDRAAEELAEGRLVAVLDDAQWADEASLWVLEGLLDPSHDATVVVAGRPRQDPSPPAERLAARAAAEGSLWVLGRLDGDEVDELLAQLMGAVAGAGLRRLVDRAGGNPMLVTELVAAARRRGWIVRRDSEVFDLDDRARPDELAPNLALLRLDELDEDERELLRVAAVFGSTFTLAHLVAMLDRPPAALVPVLERLVAAELLVSDAERLGFRHDLVRESVYEEIADWARAALHAQAAEVLRLDGAADPEVAHHLGRGEPAVDPAIGGAFRRAGQTLLHTDPAAARSLFERALELTPDPDGALVAELVLATTWAGSPEEGERLARTHLGVDAVAVRHALAHNLLAQGRMAEAADEVTLVAGSHGAEARRRFLAESALLRALAFQHAGAEAAAGELLDGVDAAGNTPNREDVGACIAWCARSWVASQEGRADEAVRAGERAVAAVGSSQAALRYHPHYFLAQALLGADQFDRFDEVAGEGRATSVRLGTVWQLPVWSSTIAAKHLRAGDWDRALAEAEVGLGWARDTESRIGVPWLMCHQALVALWRGEQDAAADRLSDAQDALGDDLRPGSDGVLWVQGLLAEEQGDLDTALGSLGALWDLAEGLGVVARLATIGPDVVRVALAAGDLARAKRVVDALDRHREVSAPPSAVAGADRCRGLVLGDADVLARACAGYEGSPAVTEAAMAHADAAAAFAAGGNPERAGVHARAALAAFDRMGAHLLAARVRRTVGDRVSDGHDARRDPRSLLSPAELRVAGLVAAGASNPEVAEALHLSRRTVESHLSHIFTKLGIRSRVDLAVLMADGR